MPLLQEHIDTGWAHELALLGGSATTIATVCGRSRRWGRNVLKTAGAPPTKRIMPISRERAFMREPARRGHVHIVLLMHFSMAEEIRLPERLVRLARAYRAVTRPPIFCVDELYELVVNVLAEQPAETRACTKCSQPWYEIATSGFACPACQGFEQYLCKQCGGAIPAEGPQEGEGFEHRRGRPRSYCARCPPLRARARRAKTAGRRARGSAQQRAFPVLTSGDDTARPTPPPTRRA